MDSYSDIKIIEANRLHSEEAKSGNNENTSLWTNNLQDILHLQPKDVVSIHGAFISERGVGQASSIEVKGVELGEKKEFQYINQKKSLFDGDRLNFNLPSRASVIEAEVIKETYPLRDDTLRFIINYYIPASATNSLHLPRRWMWHRVITGVDISSQQNFYLEDGRMFFGMSQTDYDAGKTTPKIHMADDLYSILTIDGASENFHKPKNDNSRYTLMIRDKTFFTDNSISSEDLPLVDMRDPENAVYHTLREMKTIEIPPGFNSAEFISTEITRQLQAITSDEILEQDNTDIDKYPMGVSKLLETETYKAIYSGNVEDNSYDNFIKYFNLTTGDQGTADKAYVAGWKREDGFEWLRQYNIIACKYPEIYETGKLINMNSDSENTGISGASIKTEIDLDDANLSNLPFEIDIPYTEKNCKLFRDFFNAQGLYPEIIDNLNNYQSGYGPGFFTSKASVDNTRYMYINRYDSLKQSLATPPTEATTQLGWGGYYQPRSYNYTSNLKTTQLCSLLMPIFFRKEDKEIFYEVPNTENGGGNEPRFSYGCLGKSSTGSITIFPGLSEISPFSYSPVFTELKSTPTTTPNKIEVGRKIGFDLHFNAPGMYYLLPLSGWAKGPNPLLGDPASGRSGEFRVANDIENGTLTQPTMKMSEWKKLLYVGADSPKLIWNGTNFSFSDFHTGLNRGQVFNAGLPIYGTALEDNPDDVVYNINPLEKGIDYTPDRKPYNFGKNILGEDGTTAFKINNINQNIQKWKIYDSLSGILIEDFGVSQDSWDMSLFGLLGFSYKQFHSTNTNRQIRVQSGNANNLSVLTTNAEVFEGDTKIYMTNWAGTALYNNMISTPVLINGFIANKEYHSFNQVYPPIVHKTESIQIIADNLPTRMIRGYYTIRSNILEGTPFIGGKINNTNMPVIGIVNKISNFGDFTFGEESSLQFTITKPIRLASLAVSIHDPDGSYARTSPQSTILFKVQKPVQTTFNIAQEIIQEQTQKQK